MLLYVFSYSGIYFAWQIVKSDMFPEQAKFFCGTPYMSKKVGYQKLILSVFISKFIIYNKN